MTFSQWISSPSLSALLIFGFLFPSPSGAENPPEFPEGWHASARDTTVWLQNPQVPWTTRIQSEADADVLEVHQNESLWFRLEGLVIHPGVPGREPAVLSPHPARRVNLRTAPTGSGSVSLHRNSYQRVDNLEPLEGARTWWTVGADTSDASGTQGLWVAVWGHDGFGLRAVEAPLFLPGVEPADIQLDGHQFSVALPNDNLILRGTLLFPAAPHIELTAENGGTRVRFWLRSPDDKQEPVWEEAVLHDDLTLEDPDDLAAEIEVEMPEHARRVLGAVATSTAMGAPGLQRRVNQQMALVLTVSNAPPPEPEKGKAADQVLFKLGRQTVRYWEHLIEFETGMRDVLSTLKGRKSP
ncbi:MAG: hypothetical protein JJU29_05130 [Verrucomicrobia bacterium]|nr:hypothetical protein [Verrucomicrobiota bacterium]MCH8511323.1 hypothetical protein [Kiritimatiellia bacterium]